MAIAEKPICPVRIGVLALQGSFREHISSLRKLPGVEALEVRTKEELNRVDGLIIPGGMGNRR
jgi:5'-phosphate synthase pdxT subunit